MRRLYRTLAILLEGGDPRAIWTSLEFVESESEALGLVVMRAREAQPEMTASDIHAWPVDDALIRAAAAELIRADEVEGEGIDHG